MREYSIIEALPELRSIDGISPTKQYSQLKLNVVSDFKIIRAIWANTLTSSIYD